MQPNLELERDTIMRSLTLQDNPSDSYIEKGLCEIFGPAREMFLVGKNDQHIDLLSVKINLNEKMGIDETRGMFQRAGRASFYYWMRLNSSDLGWKETSFRLLPPAKRIRRSLCDLLKWMDRENYLKAELMDSLETWQILATGLIGPNARLECNYFVGLLQELCCWAGAGKFYPARETHCQAAGEKNCVILIEKKPAI